MDHCSIERVVASDISLLYNNGKWIIMKKPLVIFASLLLFSSSPAFTQPEPSALIQPLMDCLTQALPIEKAKPSPQLQAVKDACVNEMQLLSILPPDVVANLIAEIDVGLAQHLAE